MQVVKSKVGSQLDLFLDRLSSGKDYVARMKREVDCLESSSNLVKECGAICADWFPMIENQAKNMKRKLPTSRITSGLASDCKLVLNDIKIVIDSHEIIAKEVSKLPSGANPKYLPHTLDFINGTVKQLRKVAVQILKILEEIPDVNENELFKFSTELNKKKELETMKAREKEQAAVAIETEYEKQMEKETKMVANSIEKASEIYGWNTEYRKLVLVLSKYKPRSTEFIKLLAQVESGLCSDKCDNVVEIETAQDYDQLTDDTLRNNGCIIRGLIEKVGLEVPDVTFENLGTFDDGRIHKFTDSTTGSDIKSNLEGFLEQIRKRDAGEPYIILNLLSDEISGTGHDFKLPQLLLLKSVICQIENSSNLSKDDLEFKKMFVQTINRMTRYLIVSMKDAFTDLHVDPAGSSVYYHVIKGRKIVWMAPPTEENLDLYQRFENETNRIWNVSKFLQEFQRVEIREGNTLLIPPAWPHFVYTPTDTIVVGGNYLKLEDVDLHFKVVQIEKETNAAPSHCFPFFWDTMYAYVRLIFIPKLEKARENGTMTEKDRTTATMLYFQLYSQLFQDEHPEKNSTERKAVPKVFNQKICEKIVQSLKVFSISVPEQMDTGKELSEEQESAD